MVFSCFHSFFSNSFHSTKLRGHCSSNPQYIFCTDSMRNIAVIIYSYEWQIRNISWDHEERAILFISPWSKAGKHVCFETQLKPMGLSRLWVRLNVTWGVCCLHNSVSPSSPPPSNPLMTPKSSPEGWGSLQSRFWGIQRGRREIGSPVVQAAFCCASGRTLLLVALYNPTKEWDKAPFSNCKGSRFQQRLTRGKAEPSLIRKLSSNSDMCNTCSQEVLSKAMCFALFWDLSSLSLIPPMSETYMGQFQHFENLSLHLLFPLWLGGQTSKYKGNTHWNLRCPDQARPAGRNNLHSLLLLPWAGRERWEGTKCREMRGT